jgi:transcriptional regulator GlxA family with amidase domain
MPIHDYQTRVRLRHAISRLRSPDSKVEVVSRAVGYRAVKNLRRLCGRTPASNRPRVGVSVTLMSRLS